jgi:hypothetical protein
LCKFLNIEEGSDEYTILCGWLFSAYRGKGPYIIMPIGGEAGSAKSDAAQLVRSLVDPCVGGLSGPPKSDDDLFVQAKNQYVLAFDNLSHISAEMADSVCRLATGGGHVKRTLYTDDDQSVFDGARPIIMTSIVSVATRSDLASRSTPIMLSEIPPEKRRPQEDVYAGFDKLRPRIIGAICDIVAYGLTQIDNIRPNYLPRMADAAKWVMACEGLIWEAGSYMGAFEASQADAADNVLDGSLVWRELKSFLFDDDGKWRADWQGPMSDLLERLESHTNRLTVDGVEITRAIFLQMVRVGPSKGSDEPGNPFYPMVPVGWTTLTTPPESGFDVEYEGSLIIYDSAHLYRCSWGKWALVDLDYVGHVYTL